MKGRILRQFAGILGALVMITLAVPTHALASAVRLPVVRTVDDTHVGKPDDIGDGMIYLKPQDLGKNDTAVHGDSQSWLGNRASYLGLLRMLLGGRIGS